MNFLIIPLSLMCGLVLSATAVSVAVVYRAYRLMTEIDSRAKHAKSQKDGHLQELQPLRESVNALSLQIRDLQSHPQAPPPAGSPRGGFNLNKRSQALRMHRRGEPAEQIAASLDLPRQEVELLLKVHRIVIQNV
jgi:Protein of unknown function (DUF2802)